MTASRVDTCSMSKNEELTHTDRLENLQAESDRQYLKAAYDHYLTVLSAQEAFEEAHRALDRRNARVKARSI